MVGMLVGILWLAAGVTVWAQVGAGSIYGSVTDATGARIPGATVVLTNQATGVQREVTTDQAGSFRATPLQIGRYIVRVTASGFQATEVRNLVLEVEQRREVNVTLQVATGTETVEVTAATVPLLESTVSDLGQVIQERSIVELPLNGRNFVQLGTLSPGAIKSEGGQFNNPAASTSVRGSTSLSVNGARENANDWTIDGIDNNELTAGSISVLPSVDAIQEFKVLTNKYSAQYGRNAGGTILINTKSGGNDFHGTVYEFLRNDKFDAKGFFDSEKPEFRQNQFGFTIGGPIVKDKLFFFGGYEGLRIRKGLTFISSVPTALERVGDFSEAGQAAVFDPCATFDAVSQTCTAFHPDQASRTQFPGNVIPANRIDPIALQVLDFFPLPNLPGFSNNFRHASKRELDQNQYIGRVDYTLSPSDTFFGRFSLDNTDQFFPGPLPGFGGGTSAFISATINEPRARNLALVWNHVFSPTLINQAVAGFNRIFISVVGPSFGQDISAQLGIPGANLGSDFSSGLTRFNLSAYNGLGDRLTTPLILGSNVFHYADNLTWIRGEHEMNMGFAVRFNQLNGVAYSRPRGDMSFNQLFTRGTAGSGDSVASMLLGLPASMARTNVFGGDMTGRRWEDFRFYFQDDWHVNPQLTFNLGLAYMVITASTEAHGRYANIDLGTETMLIAGIDTSATGGVKTDKDNIQPRLGFAYTPFQGRSFVIRGGYGIFHDWAQGGMTGIQVNPPFIDEPQFDSDSITPARLLSDGFPAPVQQDPDNPSGAAVFWDPNYEQGVVQQWNLTLQQELGWETVLTVAYVGSKGDKLQDKEGSFNSPPPGPGSIGARRPFPSFGSIQRITSRGETRYHGLQTKLEKRFSDNLYFLMGYTWSKGIGNEPSQNLTFQGSATGAVYRPFFPHGPDSDTGLNANDLRHSFTFSYIYDLPFGRNQAYMSDVGGWNHLVGGWQLSGITRMRSGFPLGATISPSLLNNTMANRPDVVCDPNLSSSERSLDRWFDTSCFVQTASFTFGNSGRTFGQGPNQYNFDFSIFKRFELGERITLQFRTEIFNIFNTPQFDLPSTTIGTGGAGRITATINDPRDIQFGLKLIF